MKLINRLDNEITVAVAGLDCWLEAMRCPGGYGGPVTHWWRDCLEYTLPGLDWRYEGIILGYLNLWVGSADLSWLQKAKRAADDLVAGQLPSGNYRNSRFELNPGTGGTPHEAACDLALLKLAEILRDLDDSSWQIYFRTAGRNLKEFCIRRLWNEADGYFYDIPGVPSFVPNKAATLAEALFAYARITGELNWAERYAMPTLDKVVAYQANEGELEGAVYQNSFGPRKVAKFFPFYTARCIPGLLEGLAWSGDVRFGKAAQLAARFILRWRYLDGSFPQVVYPAGRFNRWPQWIAGVGDILRGLDLTRPLGLEYDPVPSLGWLLAGRRADGAFQTALGFGRAGLGCKRDDPRDDLPVVGWNDKVFRYLTGILRQGSFPESSNQKVVL